ncbi:MAG: SCO family protein [Halocynthiibacter sp.]
MTPARHQLAALVLLGLVNVAPGWASQDGAGTPTPFPASIGGAFELRDTDGNTRTQADPDGRTQLLYFGYANCPGMCPVALPLMAEIVDMLAVDGIKVRPVMITVDQVRDTPGAMAAALAKYHEDFVGLTGEPAALARVYEAFSVAPQVMFEDEVAGTIYAHATQIFVLSGDGQVMSVLPPILPTETLAGIVARYATSPITTTQ